MNFFKKEGQERFGLAEPEKEIKILSSNTDLDFPDRRIVSVHQVVHGVPVFGARVTLEVIPGKRVVNLTNGFIPSRAFSNVRTIPTLTWIEAIDRAVEVYGKRSDSTSRRNGATGPSEPCAVKIHLTIFDPQRVTLQGEARLAWMVRLGTLIAFIDAHDGSTIFHYNDIQSILWRRTYDLDGMGQEYSGQNDYLVLADRDPIPNLTVSFDAQKAHETAKKAYMFYKHLGVNSYDNQGSSIDSNVRVADPEAGFPFGQWNPHAKMSIFPSGIPVAQDIVGHEFTHGVLQFVPSLAPDPSVPYGGLFNFGESGALNEGLADFFGAQIDGLNWTIGENLPNDNKGNPWNIWPLRDMADPHKGTFDLNTTNCTRNPPGFYPKCDQWEWNRGQPDHYAEKVTPSDLICGVDYYSEFGADNGCIHLNSGIFNKAMYLAANGGGHHGVHVTGIKKNKLVRIMFRTMNQKLTTFSDLKTTAEKSVESCSDLIGKYQIKQADCTEVKKAFTAVGLLGP